MLTFFIHFKDYPPSEGIFYWKCYSGNNREIFKHCYVIDGRQAPKQLRNCVNHINTIGRHLVNYNIHITAEANAQRKKLGEPLYGCFAATGK
jgi:hypothetical protein